MALVQPPPRLSGRWARRCRSRADRIGHWVRLLAGQVPFAMVRPSGRVVEHRNFDGDGWVRVTADAEIGDRPARGVALAL